MFKKVYNLMADNRLLTGILLAGIIVRLVFFLRADETIPITSDDAIPGLMAKHILNGEFPAVYWGQSYMGTLESFFQSIFIYLLGTIPLSVRIYPLLVGILFILVTYKLADEMYNRNVALISLGVLSIPTVYLSICASMVPPDNYIATVLMGSLALLFLHRILYKPITEEQRMRYYILLGFLSGLGFWIQILYIDYIGVIFLFLFIHDKLFFLRKNFRIFVLFFIIGSLPLILYNITYNFDTFSIAKGVGLRQALNKVILFKAVIPVLLGMRLPIAGDNRYILSLPEYWGSILGAVYVIAFLYIIISRRKNILGLLTLSAKKVGPTEILLALIVISAIVFIRTERANSWAIRYMLPIISAVPILLSIAVYDIWKKQKVVGGVVLGIILIIQLYGNARVYATWGSSKIVEDVLELPDTRPLISFLDSKNITRAYAHYWISYRLTYETGERIICSQAYDERFGGRYRPKYKDIVDGSRNVAFIFHPTLGLPYDLFEENLKAIGGSYRKEIIGPYTIFYDFIPPWMGEPISPSGWTAETNYSSDDVSRAFDRDISTRWATRSPQRPGAYFLLDMGESRMVTGISIFLGRFSTDFPRGVVIETSMDKVVWKTTVELQKNIGSLVWQNDHPVFEIEDRRDELFFEPVEARYIKITQTGTKDPFDWSIAELYVYELMSSN